MHATPVFASVVRGSERTSPAAELPATITASPDADNRPVIERNRDTGRRPAETPAMERRWPTASTTTAMA